MGNQSKTICNLAKLNQQVKCSESGLLFCFGTSLISQLIRNKTKLYSSEIVPSHVAIYYKGFIYESTSNEADLKKKTIPSGVRRYLFKDFLKIEANKDTTYVYIPYKVDINVAEKFIHYPYGILTIVEFLFKDSANGKANGLICSQYANYVTKVLDAKVVTPAELYRAVIN